MPTYVARYTYRTDDATREEKSRLAPQHREFIRSLDARGVLLVAGPWGKDEADGGLVVVSAAERAAADALIGDDPYVRAGLLSELTVTNWRAILGPLATGFPAE